MYTFVYKEILCEIKISQCINLLMVWRSGLILSLSTKGIRPKEASLPLRQLSQASSTTNTAIIVSSSPLCLSLRVCKLLPVLVQTYFFCNLQIQRFHYSHRDSFKLQIRKLSHLLFQLTCNPFPFT